MSAWIVAEVKQIKPQDIGYRVEVTRIRPFMAMRTVLTLEGVIEIPEPDIETRTTTEIWTQAQIDAWKRQPKR